MRAQIVRQLILSAAVACKRRGTGVAGKALLIAVLALSLFYAAPAQAYVFGSGTISQTVSLNIIDVCDTTGTLCAPAGNIQTYEAYASAIYSQAGIAFAPSVVHKLNLPNYSDCGITTASTVCTDGLLSSSRDLVNSPGHGQSTTSNTLNVYLVNNLVTAGGASYGWGLIGGNGLVVATGTNPTTHLTAAIDTLAHELGHNLGLDHVDQADNLMKTSARTTPFDACQIPPYSCIQVSNGPAGTTAKASVAASPILTLADVTGITKGMSITGGGIPAGDTVVSVDSFNKTVTLASAPTGSIAAATALQFGNLGGPVASVSGITALTAGAAGATQIRLVSTAGLKPGLVVTGAGIPINDRILTIDPLTNTIKLATALAGAVASGAALNFVSPATTDKLLDSGASKTQYTATGSSAPVGGTTLKLAQTEGADPGMAVTGTGIAAGTVVTLVDATTGIVTLSKPLTAAVGAGAPMQFLPKQITTLKSMPVLNELPFVTVQVPGTPVHMVGDANACAASGSTCMATTIQGVTTGGLVVDIRYRFAANGVTALSASFMKPNYLYNADGTIKGQDGFIGDPSITGTLTSRPIGTGIEWVLTPSRPVPVGSYFDVTFSYPIDPGHIPGVSVTTWAYVPPFSTAFDFTNGLSSRGGYDGTGFDSSQGQEFAFDPNTPCLDPTAYTCVTFGPSILPTAPGLINPTTGQPVIEDIDTSGVDPYVIAAAVLPFAGQDPTTDTPLPPAPPSVPEPASLLIVGTALVALAGLRRRGLRPAPLGSAGPML